MNNTASYTYQWKVNGTNISGATSDTYQLTESEVGKQIEVTFSYINNYGQNVSVTSLRTEEVTGN